jgi:hypothetical protein
MTGIGNLYLVWKRIEKGHKIIEAMLICTFGNDKDRVKDAKRSKEIERALCSLFTTVFVRFFYNLSST